jgi:hypothetical protein
MRVTYTLNRFIDCSLVKARYKTAKRFPAHTSWRVALQAAWSSEARKFVGDGLILGRREATDTDRPDHATLRVA